MSALWKEALVEWLAPASDAELSRRYEARLEAEHELVVRMLEASWQRSEEERQPARLRVRLSFSVTNPQGRPGCAALSTPSLADALEARTGKRLPWWLTRARRSGWLEARERAAYERLHPSPRRERFEERCGTEEVIG